jgi:hypothetical protein
MTISKSANQKANDLLRRDGFFKKKDSRTTVNGKKRRLSRKQTKK